MRIRREQGFGFVELLVLIVIVGILTSVAMRSMTGLVEDNKEVATELEMEMLANGIVGDPNRTTNNMRSDFGYVGDVGAFPPSLYALYTNPGYATWDGPYIPSSYAQDTTSYRLDSWGTPYTYSGGLSITSTGSGSTISKKIADNTSDYLRNQFAGIVADANDSLPGTIKKDSVRVRVTFPNGAGGTSAKNYTPSAVGEFLLDSIPAGIHPLQVIYLPQNDTLARQITVLPRHQNTDPPIFKFSAGYFGGSNSGCGLSVTIRPNGSGSEDELSGCSSANWQCVDEVAADEATTVVQRASNSWASDLYALSDPAAGACTPSRVTVYIRCRRAQSQGDARPTIRVNGTTYTGASNALSSSWTNYSHIWTSNPSTNAAWTWSDINNLQAGVDLRGQNSNFPAYCTQVWVVVEY